jgi:type I restriction enzyme S subunit
MSNNDGLPKGWIKSQLADLIKPRRERVRPAEFKAHPFIGMEHVEPHTMRLIETVPAGQMKSSSAFFQPNDVLYGRLRPYLNKVLRPEFEGLCSAEFIVFPDLPYLRSSFLQYRLNSNDFVSFASHLNEGDRPRVDFDQIGSFEVNLPPEPEQHRIVAKIEELFSDLDAGVAALERIKANLKRYRAAVLKAAVEGKLTKEWRAKNPPKETATQLLKRILIERRNKWEETQLVTYTKSGKSPPNKWKDKYKEPAAPDISNLPELPKGWCWATVEQMSQFARYGSSEKTSSETSGVPVLRMGNIQDGMLDLSNLKYLPSHHSEFPDLLLEKGDLLFNRTNSAELVGKSAVYLSNPSPCSYASYLITVRFMNGCNSLYVCYYINSHYGRSWVASVVSQQVGQANVNGTKLQHLAFPLPPVHEQEQIVNEVEQRLSIIEEAEIQIEANLKRAARLRQSILKRAFEGKLVPQDPRDEQASVLLEHIQEYRNSVNTHICGESKHPNRLKKPFQKK